MPDAICETTYYSDQAGVRVTDKRLIIGGTTYSMANIASVQMRSEYPDKGNPFAIMALGVTICGAGFAVHGGAVLGLPVGIALLAGGYLWYRGCKPLWHLRISSVSGESSPLKSAQKEWIGSIARAINEAMIHRA